MNYRGFKQASRQCLGDSGLHLRRLTALFLLCYYVISVSCDGISYLLDLRVQGASGLDAVALRNQADLWSIASLMVISLLWWLWSAGYTAFALRLSRGRATGFGDFFTGFRQAGRVLAVMLLQSLYIWLWSMLFVIPGIVAFYRYRMAVFLILDDPSLSASGAISASARLTYGHKLELLLLDLSFFWYYLPSLLAAGLLYAYNYDLVPALSRWPGLAGIYLINLVLPAVMDFFAMAHVRTTFAHVYNWLRSLDQSRRDEALHWPRESGPAL